MTLGQQCSMTPKWENEFLKTGQQVPEIVSDELTKFFNDSAVLKEVKQKFINIKYFPTIVNYQDFALFV
jgi:hypothetical protein